MIWHDSGGSGQRTILLLHGIGATAGVWEGVRTELERRSLGRWIAVDLSGHGGSQWQPHYSVGRFAADLANLLRDAPDVFIVGHSLGTYVALALASRWFGVQVSGVLGIGPKISWPDADLQTARDLASRAVRDYPTNEEAWARYRRVSGLDATVAPEAAVLSRGVLQTESGWRLSQDPRTFAVAGAPFATLASSAQCRLVLARGVRDAMVSREELETHAAETAQIADAGHNAHVEKPEVVVALLEQLLAMAGREP